MTDIKQLTSWSFSTRLLVLVLLFFMGSFLALGQSSYEGKGENRINVAWAYYGRGDGLSLVYDHGFSNLFSAGAGMELYVIEGERETSFFGIVDLHLKELLELPERLDLYPGAEIGSFDGEFNI
ncbi:MAG: hypothetical protein MUO53_17270 [Maribacter sp.]|nr:hypothetical protein [Maribacter sp.]